MNTQKRAKNEHAEHRATRGQPRERGKETSAGGGEAIADLMDRFGKALTAGDGAAVAQLWTVPALVLFDGGTRPVATIEEVEAFFSHGKEQYAARGIKEARPEIQAIDWMTSQLANVTVRWPYIDQAGKEIGEDRRPTPFVRPKKHLQDPSGGDARRKKKAH